MTDLGAFVGIWRVRVTTRRWEVRPDRSSAQFLGALNDGPLDIDQVVGVALLAPANILRRLRELRVFNLVVQPGGPGLPTTYERTR